MKSRRKEVTEKKVLSLVHCYLQRAVECLRPLSDEMIVHDHQHETFAPDYLHPKHTPRAATFVVQPSQGSHEVDTNPHLLKLHDLLAMAIADWHDVNIYVANTFAGFSSYGVRWSVQDILMI